MCKQDKNINKETDPKYIFFKRNMTKPENILLAIKIITVISMPIGFVYLFSYTAENNIPMPLSLSELPILLMAITFFSFWITLILLGFVFFPVINHVFLSKDKNKKNLFNIIEHKRKFFISAVAVPLLLMMSAIYLAAVLKIEGYYIILPAVVLSVIIIWFFTKKNISEDNKEKKKQFFVDMLFFVITSFLWIYLGFVLCLVLAIKYLPELNNLSSAMGFVLIISFSIILIILIFLMVVPSRKYPPIPHYFWLFIGLMLIIIPPLTPFSKKLTEISLRMMKLGGGFQAVIILDEPYSTKVPPSFINPVNPELTLPLSIILDLGRFTYVKVGKSDKVYTFPSEVMLKKIYVKKQ